MCIHVFTHTYTYEYRLIFKTSQNAQKRKNGNYTAKSAVNSQGAVRQRAAAATHTAIRSATAATMNAAVALAASRK